MDNFDWDMMSPTVNRSSNFVLPSCIWSTCDIFPSTSSTVEDSRSSMSETVLELNPSRLGSLVGLHEVAPRGTAAVEIAVPSLHSVDSSLDLDSLQNQELSARLLIAADSAPPMKTRSGSAALREQNIPPHLHASLAPANGPKIGSPASCLTESFVPSAVNKEEDLSAILYSCSSNISTGESELNCGSLVQLHQLSDRNRIASQSPSNPECPPHAKRSKGVGVKRGRSSGESGRVADVLPSKPWGKGNGGIQINFRSALNVSKKARRTWTEQKHSSGSSSIDFGRDVDSCYEPDIDAVAQVKLMMYRAAAMRPVNLGADEQVEKPKRKNVRISSDPQTMAARHRRERISERLRVLQKLVPGGNKMDTASMLDEAASYLKFLKSQVRALETVGSSSRSSMSNNKKIDMVVNSAAAATTSPFPLPLNHRQAFPMQHLFHSPKL